jgi:hypothetical protein
MDGRHCEVAEMLFGDRSNLLLRLLAEVGTELHVRTAHRDVIVAHLRLLIGR